MNYLIYENGIAMLKTGGTYRLFKYGRSPFSKGELFYEKRR